ncbi:MAG: GAF domain-containing protein [Bacteroidales bacterium]|nr:GAF domain-containing protein [Bacteroidales bacterium]
MKIKVQSKLIIYILLTALVIFLSLILYFSYGYSKENEQNIKTALKESVINSSLKIQGQFNSQICALRTIANSISGTNIIDEKQRFEIYKESINRFLEDNPIFDNVKISWELFYIDPSWQKSFGRKVYNFQRGDGSLVYSVSDQNKEGDDFSSPYYKVKVTQNEFITGIELENSDNLNSNAVYKLTIYIPINDSDDNFCAFVSADIAVDNFTNYVKNSLRYESFATVLLTDLGQIAGASLSIDDSQSDIVKIIYQSSLDIKAEIDSLGFSMYNVSDSLNRKFTVCGVSVDNSIFSNNWILVSAIPYSIINSANKSNLIVEIFIVILGLIVLGIVVFLITSKVVAFLTQTAKILKKLSAGNFNSIPDIEIGSFDELSNIASSLNNLKSGLGRAVGFAEEIGKSNFNANFTPLSKNDELGLSLLRMRDSLNLASQEDAKRKEMDRKQNWITEGSAKFGDILRQYNNDMSDFSFNIISNLVKYIGANQGGLFVINDDDKDNIYFELTAGYAYNIRKILKKNVQPGVGLVGRCILEAESIYINNLPEDYINISSGLGEKSPSNLLIVPFKFNNEIYAVAEIASFKTIEEYKRQFIEEVGHSIASTIATVKINVRTNKLLNELKIQREELVSQEEEMRQNMEAMKFTQEDMLKKTEEYEQTSDVLNQLIMVVSYTPEGKVIDVNSKALELFLKPKSSFVENGEELYQTISESERTETDDFWLQIRLGRQKVVKKEIKINDVHYNIVESYNPVQNYYGKIYKVICLITNLEIISIIS